MAAQGCIDSVRPTLRILAASARRTGVRRRGEARDAGCSGGAVRVEIALGGKRFAAAHGSGRWTFAKRMRLRPGRYVIAVRAADTSGNSTQRRRTLRVR